VNLILLSTKDRKSTTTTVEMKFLVIQFSDDCDLKTGHRDVMESNLCNFAMQFDNLPNQTLANATQVPNNNG
jgi:hypothetical protein